VYLCTSPLASTGNYYRNRTPEMPFLAGRAYEASTGVVLAVSYLYTLASTGDYYRKGI